jgi:hypothetical protein
MPDYVLRLDLEPPFPARLEITAADPGVGLALRAPGCLRGHELACAQPSAEGAKIGVDTAALAGAAPYLFVELPAEAAAPVVLRIEATGPSAAGLKTRGGYWRSIR